MAVKKVQPPVLSRGRETTLNMAELEEFADALRESLGEWFSNDESYGKGEQGQKRARYMSGRYKTQLAHRFDLDKDAIKGRVFPNDKDEYVFALTYKPS